MFAKQTLVSASLVAMLGGSAFAQVAAEVPAPADDEARPQPPPPPEPPPPPAPSPRRPRGVFQIGAGFSTDEQFIFDARVAQPDLFGTGNLLALDARVSSRRQYAGIHGADPHVFGSDLTLYGDLYNDRHRLPGFVRQATGITAGIAQPFGEHVRGFIGYRAETISGELDGPASLARDTGLEPSLRSGALSAVRAGLEYSTLDATLMPVRGTSIGASIEVADPRLGSDFQLTRMSAWANTHRALGPFTLHVGGTLDSVDSRDALGVPLSERLFLESSNQIRGYAPSGFGPVDLTGRPIGGNLLFTGRAEVEVPLISRIGLSAAAFYDAGGLFDRGGTGQIGQAVGFGLIWRSPIGPLRFDWAVPLGGGPARFLFGIGSSF